MREVITSNLSTASETNPTVRKQNRSVINNILPYAITIVAGIVCYWLFWRRGVWLSVIGYSIAPAERVLNGEAPYRDFLYNYTPGILWLNALLMKSFGIELKTIAAGLFVFKIATLVVLLSLARRVISGWAALIPVALTLAWIGYKYVFGVFPTQYSLVFALLAMICMLRYNETGKLMWLLFCGLATGVVFLFKYNVGILLVGSGTAAIAIREILASGQQTSLKAGILAALKRSSIYWAGFLIVFIAMAATLAREQALGAMVDHFVHHIRAYGVERAIPLPHPKLLVPVGGILYLVVIGAFLLLRLAPRYFEAFLLIALGALSAVIIFPGRAMLIKTSASATVSYLPSFLFLITAMLASYDYWQARKNNEVSSWWQSNGTLAIVGLFTLAVYLEVYPRADHYHLVRVLPPVFLLLLLLVARGLPLLESYLQSRMTHPRRAVMICAVVPIVLLFIIGIRDAWQPHFDSQLRWTERMPLKLDRAEGMLVTRRQSEMIETLARLIEENSRPDDPIFSFAQRGTGFHFLTGRPNPTRFVWWRSVGIKGENREAVMNMIAERQPKLIILQDALKDRRIRDAVSANYVKIGAAGDIAIYDRRAD